MHDKPKYDPLRKIETENINISKIAFPSLLEELVSFGKPEPPKYHIGVDTYDKNSASYCLVSTFDGNWNIILIKRMNDMEAFEEEVNNLAKYFNAEIIKSK